MRGLKSYGPKRRFLVLLVALFAESGTMVTGLDFLYQGI